MPTENQPRIDPLELEATLYASIQRSIFSQPVVERNWEEIMKKSKVIWIESDDRGVPIYLIVWENGYYRIYDKAGRKITEESLIRDPKSEYEKIFATYTYDDSGYITRIEYKYFKKSGGRDILAEEIVYREDKGKKVPTELFVLKNVVSSDPQKKYFKTIKHILLEPSLN